MFTVTDTPPHTRILPDQGDEIDDDPDHHGARYEIGSIPNGSEFYLTGDDTDTVYVKIVDVTPLVNELPVGDFWVYTQRLSDTDTDQYVVIPNTLVVCFIC